MSIHKKVRELRRAKPIPAVDFAKMCGQTSRQWTYKFERGGIKRIPNELISKFAEIFDKPESYFLEDDSNQASDNELFYPEKDDLNEIEGYKDRYIYLLIENRRLMAENIRLKNLMIENGIDYKSDNQADNS